MSESRVPDLDALRMLRAVLQYGSIAAAAATLGRTQQAVSARMRSLEAIVGVPVLVRGPRGATPTAAGTLLATWADDVLQAADRLEVGIRTLTRVGAAPVRIGSSQTIAENLLPRWLIRLRRMEEEMGLLPTSTDLRVGNSTEVANLLRARDVEIGFVETSRLPTDLHTVRLGDDELVTVVAPTHPWASLSAPLSLAELAETPLVMREAGSGTRDAFADILAAFTPPLAPRPQVELGTAAAVRSAIGASVGPGVLSRLAVRDDLVLGRLTTVIVDASPFLRQFTAIRAPRVPLSAGASRLLKVASDHFSGTHRGRSTTRPWVEW